MSRVKNMNRMIYKRANQKSVQTQYKLSRGGVWLQQQTGNKQQIRTCRAEGQGGVLSNRIQRLKTIFNKYSGVPYFFFLYKEKKIR